MSIEFACPHCQKGFRVKDKFAGRSANCTRCKATLRIPDTTPCEKSDLEESASSWVAPERSQPSDSSSTSDGKYCPACGSTLAAKAVICIACGFDLRSGKELSTDRNEAVPSRIKITIPIQATLCSPEEYVLGVWITSLRESLESHLNACSENTVIPADLTLSVDHFRCATGGTILKSFTLAVRLTASGTVAGKSKKARLKDYSYHNSLLNLLSPIARMAYARDNIKAIRGVVTGQLDKTALTPAVLSRGTFYSKIEIALIEKIDKLLGRDRTPVAKRWRTLKIAGVLASIACGVAAFYFAEEVTLEERSTLCGVVFVVALALSYGIGACFMPASFFEDYGAGRRIMSVAGANTGAEASVKLRIAIACAVVGLGAMAYSILNLFYR